MTGITYEKHLELGPKLAEMHTELCHIAVLVCNCTGKNKPATKAAHRALKYLSAMRSELDTELNRLIPHGDPRESGIILVYYPVRS